MVSFRLRAAAELNSPSAKIVATKVARNVLRIALSIFVSMNLMSESDIGI